LIAKILTSTDAACAMAREAGSGATISVTAAMANENGYLMALQ